MNCQMNKTISVDENPIFTSELHLRRNQGQTCYCSDYMYDVDTLQCLLGLVTVGDEHVSMKTCVVTHASIVTVYPIQLL